MATIVAMMHIACGVGISGTQEACMTAAASAGVVILEGRN